MDYLKILIVMEIIGVNVITITRCANKKYSWTLTCSVLALFTVVVVSVGYALFGKLPFFNDGNGLFNIFGLVYLIPCYFLAKESLLRLFVIFCMAWFYSLGSFIFAVQIAKLLPLDDFIINILIVQTLVLAYLIYPFQKIVVPRYTYMLTHLSTHQKQKKWLFTIGSFQYITLLVISYDFARQEGSFLKILLVILLECTMLLCYLVLYNMVHSGEQIRKLNETLLRDEMTGTFNRECLFNDLETQLSNDKSFTVLFIDLDSFKGINDEYGHLAGDWYLKKFSQMILDIIGNRGKLYRFGGDEFVVVYQGKNIDKIVDEISVCQQWPKSSLCPFRGASVGTVFCQPPHITVEEVLTLVDKRMYEKKSQSSVCDKK